jgi:hypothetical protein
MAEAIGVVSGIVGLAAFSLELSKSVVKLKDFAKDVRNAPKEVADLLIELENLANILELLAKQGSTHPPQDEILNASLQFCQAALQQMSSMTNQLEVEIRSKRRRTSLKVALKAETITKLLDRLERSKSNLNLAYSLYDRTCRQRENEMILLHVQQTRVSEDALHLLQYSPPLRTPQACAVRDDDSDQISRSRSGQQRRKTGSERHIRVHLPLWLCRTAWDISMQWSVGCRTLSLQPIVWIPSKHRVWEVIEDGGADEVMNMLERREIPLHAQNDYTGESLIGVHGWSFFRIGIVLTTSSSLFRIVMAVLRRDCRNVVQSSRYVFPVMSAVQMCSDAVQRPTRRLHGLVPRYSMFAQSRVIGATTVFDWCTDIHAELTQEVAGNTWKEILVDHPCRASVSVLCKPPLQWTIEDRILLLNALSWPVPFICEVISAIDPATLTCEDFAPKQIHDAGSCSPNMHFGLLHTLAPAYGFASRIEQKLLDNIFGRAANLGVPLSEIDGCGCTPLLRMLTSCACCQSDVSRINEAFRAWVLSIAEAGVDLEAYGAEEHRTLTALPRLSRCWKRNCVFGFAYGAQPVDWFLWYKQPGDCFAGIFWDMIDHPERAVPGTWIEVEDTLSTLPQYELDSMRVTRRRSGVKRKEVRRLKNACRSDPYNDSIALQNLLEVVLTNARAWADRKIISTDDLRHSMLIEATIDVGVGRPFYSFPRDGLSRWANSWI